jgi:starch-binding outer membrane protein, SusD/RagB family
LLHAAEAKFNQVISLAPGDMNATGDATDIDYEVNRAYVGLARALLDEGKFAEAATAAHNVPDNYADSIERSANSPAEQNGVYYYTYQEVRYGISSREGGPHGGDMLGAGLPFGESGTNPAGPDPRIPLGGVNFLTTVGLDDITLDTLQQKYPQYGSAGQLATGVEARLIEAEAALQTNNVGTYLAMLNAARTVFGLGALADPGSLDARVDTLFTERGYDLWLTGHRIGDLRRLVRPVNQGGYGRAVSATWPSGAYFKAGIAYGNQLTLLIPRGEDNNPKYSDAGCHAGTVP